MHKLTRRLKELFGWQPVFGPSMPLDDLLTEIAKERSLERRRALWEEVIRRFLHDIDRACGVAGCVDPRGTGGEILAEALRGVGADPVKYFSRGLVQIMKRHLGQDPVAKVVGSLYLRQFLHELPVHLLPYAAGLLDQAGHVEWLADRRSESLKDVQERCARAWDALPKAIEREYGDDEVADRTHGVWTIAKLKQR